MKKFPHFLILAGVFLQFSNSAWASDRPTMGGQMNFGSSDQGFAIGAKAFLVHEPTGAGASVGVMTNFPDTRDEHGRYIPEAEKKESTLRVPVEARLKTIPVLVATKSGIVPGIGEREGKKKVDLKQESTGILYSPLEVNGQLSWEAKEPGKNLLRNSYGLAQSKFKLQVGGQTVGILVPTDQAEGNFRASKAITAHAYVGGGGAFGFVVPSTGQVQPVSGPALSAGGVIRASSIGIYSPTISLVTGAEVTRVFNVVPGAPELSTAKASVDLVITELHQPYSLDEKAKKYGEMHVGVSVSGTKFKTLQTDPDTGAKELKSEGSHLIEFHVGGAY